MMSTQEVGQDEVALLDENRVRTDWQLFQGT
jgi:hypothetical protein